MGNVLMTIPLFLCSLVQDYEGQKLSEQVAYLSLVVSGVNIRVEQRRSAGVAEGKKLIDDHHVSLMVIVSLRSSPFSSASSPRRSSSD
jgi:hypothetical protein